MGVGGQRHASAALHPGMTRYPLCRRLGGPQGWSARVRKISPPPNRIRSPVAVTVWQIPDAADTVVCAPDDGWRYHPKHVEQFQIYEVNTFINSNTYPTRCNVTQFISIWKLLHMFRVVPPPIIRSAYNCTTASGICHTITAICRYSGR